MHFRPISNGTWLIPGGLDLRQLSKIILAASVLMLPQGSSAQSSKNGAQADRQAPGQTTLSKLRSNSAKPAATSAPSKPTAMKASSKPAAPRSYITNWPTGQRLVALTYDDGPDPKITPKLIDLLKQKSVPATFYVLGERVEEYPEITRRLHEEGFEVVNHTYDHQLLTKLGTEKVRWQLDHTNQLITQITGRQVTHMRPPYGGRNASVDAVIGELGMKCVLWDIDTEDWRRRSTGQMVSNILKNTTDGSIILFHDRYDASLQASAIVIDELKKKGYTFVTVGDLLSRQKGQSGLAPVSGDLPTTNSAGLASNQRN